MPFLIKIPIVWNVDFVCLSRFWCCQKMFRSGTLLLVILLTNEFCLVLLFVSVFAFQTGSKSNSLDSYKQVLFIHLQQLLQERNFPLLAEQFECSLSKTMHTSGKVFIDFDLNLRKDKCMFFCFRALTIFYHISVAVHMCCEGRENSATILPSHYLSNRN